MGTDSSRYNHINRKESYYLFIHETKAYKNKYLSKIGKGLNIKDVANKLNYLSPQISDRAIKIHEVNLSIIQKMD